MLTSAKKSNGFDICNKYLSSKNAINGNPIKEVRRTIIKTGFLNSFFIFLPYFPVFLCFYYYSIFKDIAWGEKLVIYIEFKRGDTSDLCPQNVLC
jgi:hypothetical protein